jgi:hypothetical protein
VNERDDAGAWLEALRRNSGLVLDAEGRWRYGAGFVENERVAELFHGGVAVRDDGEVTLSVGSMWAYVKCDGPARFVRAVRGARFELLGGAEVALEEVTAMGWGPDERLYLWAADTIPLKVLRTPHQALVAHLEHVAGQDGVDRLVLRWQGRKIAVAMLAEVPGPRAAAPEGGAHPSEDQPEA